MPGFIQIVNSNTLAFPDYDGNGMFKSLGNILVNPHIGMLFIDFGHPDRLRINGTATVSDEDPLLSEYPGAKFIIRVQAEHIFTNCPRYIHKMHLIEYSVYTPQPGYSPPEPEWKQMEEFRDALPTEITRQTFPKMNRNDFSLLSEDLCINHSKRVFRAPMHIEHLFGLILY